METGELLFAANELELGALLGRLADYAREHELQSISPAILARLMDPSKHRHYRVLEPGEYTPIFQGKAHIGVALEEL